jgi:hypothetical protein
MFTGEITFPVAHSCNTIYPRNMVCFRCIILNTLHKGDNKDNNNNSNKHVIIGANGRVIKGLKKNVEAIPGKHSIDSLQKAAILGTSHIIRKVLQSET